jgi:hypothetical protein
MQDAYETPVDRYDTPLDGDEETRAIEASLDPIEALLHDMNARFDRFVRIVRWGMLCDMVYSTVLMAVLVYVETYR